MIRTIDYDFDPRKSLSSSSSSSSSYKLIIPSSSLSPSSVKSRQFIWWWKSSLHRLLLIFITTIITATILWLCWNQIQQTQRQRLLWETLQSLSMVESSIDHIDQINQQLSNDIDLIRQQIHLVKHEIHHHHHDQMKMNSTNSMDQT
ncbi:hypothetical protein DERF_000721 [Dermatophagoides farinae]|uniref:Uncharacterized protein n=1 Tax=Dermatophagoides farinae TaxID=6954 RepID=A0A922I955_DERFA|nr:hypothetical protein DERF_000721 [Dermatophagoides farinae]